MIQVKITATVVTAQYGALQSGDLLRTSEAFAAHLVDECKAARYIDPPKQETAAPSARRVRKAAAQD